MVSIEMILACSQNGVIGTNNQLPWSIPADFKFFKKTTTGYPVIMGRKTYQSIGKCLPNRTNIIVTRGVDFNIQDDGMYKICHNTDEAIQHGATLNDRVFIIGGSQLYEQYFDKASIMWITVVDAEVQGDSFFNYKKLNDLVGIEFEKQLVETIPGNLLHPQATIYKFTRIKPASDKYQ